MLTQVSSRRPWTALLRHRQLATFLRLAALGLLVVCAGYELFYHLFAAYAQYPPIQSTIFLDTDPPSFPLTGQFASGSFSYSVTDSAGATVARGQASHQEDLVLSRLPDDYYVLHLNGAGQTLDVPFTVLAPFAQQPDARLGVGVHFTGGNNPGLAQLIASMGATTVRDDAPWDLIERSPGQYGFNSLDKYLPTLQDYALSPLLILDYNNRFYDRNQTPYDQAGIQAFAHYAQALVQHYGSQVQAVEVYNEYNGTLSNGPCARKPSCYVNLLRATYQAIKAVRPGVTVIGGAAFMADLPWFKAVFAAGGLASMDVVSDHPYAPFYLTSPEVQGLQNSMQGLQQLIRQYNNGRTKPIWITEIGWTTSTFHVSEQTQANYLVRGTVLSLAAGVQKIFWYDLLNDGTNPSTVQQNFGLLNQLDGLGLYTPKPAYTAYAVLARELAGRVFLTRESVLPGIFSLLFSNNLRVLWSTPVRESVTLTTNNPVTEISTLGRVETLRPVNGKIVLHLSAEPVYIEGSISGISWHLP